MVIKKIMFFILLCTTQYNYSISLATGIMIDCATRTRKPCTGKVAQERQPLFTKAEQHEQDFIEAHAQCLQAHDCDTNQLFQEIKRNIENSIVDLTNHLKELETKNDGVCHACEKTETKDIKNRLITLLATALQ